MNTFDSIRTRRSIRKFKSDPIAREIVESIIQAGIDAPSAKNRQPWRFVVVTENEKSGMLGAMRSGLEWMNEQPMESEEDRMILKGAWHTYHIMEMAPITVFIINPFGKTPFEGLAPFGERFMELANAQSLGAAIENMCLAATALGVGSLWICDIFSAYHTLSEWLSSPGQLAAALAIGYADEEPGPRPRKVIDEVTIWR